MLASLRTHYLQLTREERAARAKLAINRRFNTRQKAFFDFVLAHYVGVGVEELDHEKLTHCSASSTDSIPTLSPTLASQNT